MKQGLIAPSMMCVDFSEMTSVIEAFEKMELDICILTLWTENSYQTIHSGQTFAAACAQ